VSAQPVAPSGCPAVATDTAGWLHSWDISTGVDGPGTRLVLFLSGCPLRCLYCQNPDTWRRRDGTPTTLENMEALMRRYKPFIGAAGGGFTVSGGEPLQQAPFTRGLFEAAHRAGLHTALDTSGFLGRRADDALLDVTDLVLLDIKAGTDETHRRLTGRPLGPTLEFAERLAARGTPVWVRYVLVPGYTDDPEEVDRVAEICAGLGNVERVDVLPFHKLGEPKYRRLGIPFPLDETPVPSPELTASVRARFAAHALTTT
jgi:pyruvate formate lyase activating enzyme